MPLNRNANLRYGILDLCFRNHYKRYFWQDLAIKCAEGLNDFNNINIKMVSRRTILNDIAFMKSEVGYKAPIVGYRDGLKKYYRYSDKTFSIYNQPLSIDENNFLKKIYEIITGISGRVEYQYLKGILPKLESQYKPKKSKLYISYEENLYLKNRERLGELFISIKNKQPLTVIYKPFDEPQIKMTIHPYFLKQYNNRWFLFALEEKSKNNGIHPINLAIDRLEKVENCYNSFVQNTDIDFTTYFDNIIGVTNLSNTSLTKITILVTPTLMQYLKTKPLHQSQKAFNKVGDFYMNSIEVFPNHELYSTLLSFGSDLEVIKPNKIRNEMKEIISKMAKSYNCGK